MRLYPTTIKKERKKDIAASMSCKKMVGINLLHFSRFSSATLSTVMNIALDAFLWCQTCQRILRASANLWDGENKSAACGNSCAQSDGLCKRISDSDVVWCGHGCWVRRTFAHFRIHLYCASVCVTVPLILRPRYSYTYVIANYSQSPLEATVN